MSPVEQGNEEAKEYIEKFSEELALAIVRCRSAQYTYSLDVGKTAYDAKDYVDRGIEYTKEGLKVFEWLTGTFGTWAEDKSSAHADTWKTLQTTLRTFSEYLAYIPEWGAAISFILNIFATAPPGRPDPVVAKLNEVVKKLEEVSENIKKGFDASIAHADAAEFRDNIETPINKLWAFMLYATSTGKKKNKDDFVKACEDSTTSPLALLSALETKVASNVAGLLEAPLKGNNYRYNTFKLWANEVLHYASLLPMIQMHYFGIVDETKGKDDYKSEIQFFLNKIESIALKLESVAVWRQKMYFTEEGGKYAKEDLKKLIGSAARQVDKAPVNLDKVQAIAEPQWREFNGPTPFCMVVFFGSTKELCHTVYRVGNAEKCIVAENVLDAGEDQTETDAHIYWDMCAAVIQPVTQEMISNHHSKFVEAESRKEVWNDSTIIYNVLSKRSSNLFYKNGEIKANHQEALGQLKNVVFALGTAYNYRNEQDDYNRIYRGWNGTHHNENGAKTSPQYISFSPFSDIVPATYTYQYIDQASYLFYVKYMHSHVVTAIIYG